MLSFGGRTFKAGIVHFMAYPEDLIGPEGYLAGLETILRDEFFDVVEISRMSPDAKKRALPLVQQSGIEVGFGAQPIILKGGLDPGSPDAELRERSLKEILEAVDEAADFGAKIFGLASGPDPYPGISSPEAQRAREENLKRLTESLVKISLRASRYGMEVALEPFDRVIEKKRLLGPSTMCARVAALVRTAAPNFGLMIDLSHIPQIEETPEGCLNTLGPYVVHVHVANVVLKDRGHPSYGDQHPRFGVPGGEIDEIKVARFLNALAKLGYFDGAEMRAVSAEVKPARGEDPDTVLASTKRALIRATSVGPVV